MPTYTYTLPTPAASGASGSVAPSDATGLAQESDHEGVAQGRYIHYLTGKPRLDALTAAVVRYLQEAEDLCWQLLEERYLFTVNGNGPAEGVQLDGIGDILGYARHGLSDAAYRTLLRAWALVLRSCGKPGDLLDILDAIDGFDHIAIRECWPAFLEVYLAGTDYTTETVRALRTAKGGGIGLHVISSEADWADVHRWSGTYATEEATTTYGWGSVHDATIPGGEWASCYAEVPE